MIKHFKYLFILYILNLSLSAQVNLVPNPSFEDTVGACTQHMGMTYLGSSCKNWYTFYGSSPDYYNSCANTFSYPFASTIPQNCFGYQFAKDGQSYVGFDIYDFQCGLPSTDSIHHCAEYLCATLTASLQSNHYYRGSFYVSLADYSRWGINQLGMYLTTTQFTTTIGSYTNTIQTQVQFDTTQYISDTLNWVRVSGCFFAQGGEQYLTIGNFKDGNHNNRIALNSNYITPCGLPSNYKMTYVYIDDVSIYEIDRPDLGKDIYRCAQNDSLYIGDNSLIKDTIDGLRWYANGILINTTDPQIKVKPTVTTTYILQNGPCSQTSDTLKIIITPKCEVSLIDPIIPNTFTPNDDGINDTWQISIQSEQPVQCHIYNRWGTEIYKNDGTGLTPNPYSQISMSWDGRTNSGEKCSEGVYFYTIEYIDIKDEKKTLRGYISLFR